MIIAFRSEFLTLPMADGKPLCSEGVLLLSQLVWLQENKANSEGWVEYSQSDCERETGLSDYKQKAIRNRLESSGYIVSERKGDRGSLWLRVQNLKNSETGSSQNPKNSETDPIRILKTRKLEDSESEKLGLKNPKNSDSIPFKNLKESTPPIYTPPQVEGEPTPKPQKASVPRTLADKPESEEEAITLVQALGGSIADGEAFFAHFQARGWRTKEGILRDWKAAARAWVNRAKRWEAERQAQNKASPSRIAPKTLEQSKQETEAQILRVLEAGKW